jgi:hypothetical protein
MHEGTESGRLSNQRVEHSSQATYAQCGQAKAARFGSSQTPQDGGEGDAIADRDVVWKADDQQWPISKFT